MVPAFPIDKNIVNENRKKIENNKIEVKEVCALDIGAGVA